MQLAAKQTYIYLAFEAAISELGMENRKDKLARILSHIIQDKFATLIKIAQYEKEEPAKKSKKDLEASFVLDREFPFGKGDHQKLEAVLYDMTVYVKGQASRAELQGVALLEMFSQKREQKKKERSLRKNDCLDVKKRVSAYKLQNKAGKKIK